jgi:hypothetical protein
LIKVGNSKIDGLLTAHGWAHVNVIWLENITNYLW